MTLLHTNDQSGQYPQSYYAATATPLPLCPVLKGETRADLCVIGAGYTGLSAALHAAEAGLKVVVLEAHRVGFGASGRNGGQLGSGQRADQLTLERMVGPQDARTYWHLGEDAKALVKHLVARHKIDADLTPGVAWTGSTRQDVHQLHDLGAHLQNRYNYENVQLLDHSDVQDICPSPDYTGGILDTGAAHLHPLKFALGLADAAQKAGVTIYERSEVHTVTPGEPAILKTGAGHVITNHVILACNGYHGGLNRKIAARVMPINNFIVATEPLGSRAEQVLRRNIAVADSKFIVNYFRLSADGRLLFGGGESYGDKFPKDIASLVRKPMTQIFPQLSDVKIDYAWGGTLAITMKRLPYFARLGSNILTASGYSGHGVGTAVHAGRMMALAVQGQASGFDIMAKLPVPNFPGGALARKPLMALAMTWFGMRDRLGL